MNAVTEYLCTVRVTVQSWFHSNAPRRHVVTRVRRAAPQHCIMHDDIMASTVRMWQSLHKFESLAQQKKRITTTTKKKQIQEEMLHSYMHNKRITNDM